MKILVDADACPRIKEIVNMAQSYNIKINLYCDYSHNIIDNYANVIKCDVGSQNVDIKLSNDINKSDIVITQDYGVAVISLSKNAYAINPKGIIYTNDNIDEMLAFKHINNKLRKSGIHTKGPSKRNINDDKLLFNNLEKLINDNI